MSEATQRRVVRKATWRLMPILMAAFVVAYLDRINISIGALEMRADTGLSATAFGLGAGIFFIAYFFFEVPSNLVLHRVGARRWIARIMWTWGIITVAMMFVTGPVSFYILRALLGAAEAGFVPGIILYLSYWFPARERGKAFSWFQVAVPISFAFGSVGTGALLNLDGLVGLHGWQWIFIVTGGVAIAYGFVIWNFLPDRPADAAWLSAGERDWLNERMRSEHEHKKNSGNHTLRASFSNPSVWFLSLLYFAIILGQWGIGFWLPQILAQRFSEASHFQVSLLSAAPWLIALLAIVPVSWHSDRTGERRWHLAIPCFVSVAGFASSTYFAQPYLALAGTAVALVGLMAAVPVFWNLPTAHLTGLAAASGIALINSVGNLSGFIGPYMLGVISDATGSAQSGVALLCLSLAAAGILALLARHEPPPEPLTDQLEPQASARSNNRGKPSTASN
ncbi:MFS transporter [Saccharopolyspora sp. WRP15-2]|uniref:MFS transporter n=1 Tax=Saccharopolyspora oryzae TaxID=2997343 RepID=A0ABT4V9K2_9PSEU|nr:MFS transporter [Saccharopolyspora oryzae]MDA3630636.1 MFS transporter [Saccharopolyspora oryzae]